MKLRNKRTGKIVDRLDITIREEGVVFNNDEIYDSLAELNEEWEDYKEPKEYWFIYENGSIGNINWNNGEQDNLRKSIGNYFETKEEAEKAVEKLKAWKRLKDEYDFKFTGWKRDGQFRGDFIITAQDWNTSDDKLLDLLFGGEE